MKLLYFFKTRSIYTSHLSHHWLTDSLRRFTTCEYLEGRRIQTLWNLLSASDRSLLSFRVTGPNLYWLMIIGTFLWISLSVHRRLVSCLVCHNFNLHGNYCCSIMTLFDNPLYNGRIEFWPFLSQFIGSHNNLFLLHTRDRQGRWLIAAKSFWWSNLVVEREKEFINTSWMNNWMNGE